MKKIIKHTKTVNAVIHHNHPSGKQSPSNSDKDITEKLHRAFKEIGIKLQDHLIITKTGIFKFSEAYLLDNDLKLSPKEKELKAITDKNLIILPRSRNFFDGYDYDKGFEK